MLQDEHGDDESEDPLVELRKRLELGRARTELQITQIAARTGRSRTTIHAALAGERVPTAPTVSAMARVLGLPDEELLELRRAAADEAGTAPARAPARDEGLGRPIGDWEPHDLEVHPAAARSPAGSAWSVRALSGYVPRDHDEVLSEAVREAAKGRSSMVVLVGSSSTGKTRACWEAVQPLAAQGWRLWHPYDPTRAEAALADLEHVAQNTVVWLNEAQHYLGDPQAGERVAAALHTLLIQPGRGPVLILGTLWPEYADRYTALPRPGSPDPHSGVRELLTGRTFTVPDTFDQDALGAAEALARGGDRLLAEALTRAKVHGRIAQELAGAPELLRRYEHGSPAVRALLEAAMDARRLGVGLHLPQTFLTDAATDYLTDHDYDQLTEDWVEAAFADLARPVHGRQAALRRAAARPTRRPPGGQTPATAARPGMGPVFRLADYLEQYGRTTRTRLCPPTSFWDAAHTHLTHPDDLDNLADAAEARCRLQWAHHLRLRAADAGNPSALIHLAETREKAGHHESAEALARQAADGGNLGGFVLLAEGREAAGDREGAERLYQLAADGGGTDGIFGLFGLAKIREEARDHEAAENLYQQAIDTGHPFALLRLAHIRKEAGDHASAENLGQQAADTGAPYALVHLAQAQEEAGDHKNAEDLYRQAALAGQPSGLYNLAEAREETGDHESAEDLYWMAGIAGMPKGLIRLAQIRKEAGDHQGAENLYQLAVDTGDTDGLLGLAQIRKEAGDHQGAENLYRQATSTGSAGTLISLARIREEAGDHDGAENFYRLAANTGDIFLAKRWPYGLDPDGSPTPPWS